MKNDFISFALDNFKLNNRKIKAIFGIVILVFLTFFLAKVYWVQEVQYWSPTQVPENYSPVSIGTTISHNQIKKYQNNTPQLLHFYNPECPCSNFNSKHFIKLYEENKDSLKFIMVLPEAVKNSSYEKWQQMGISCVVDTASEIANLCGVYSTPQGVILNSNNTIYFKGNYNKARFCTSPFSNYISLAIDSLLAKKPSPKFGVLADTPYGCSYNDSSSNLNSFNTFIRDKYQQFID